MRVCASCRVTRWSAPPRGPRAVTAMRAAARAAGRRGELALLPPTVAVLEELTGMTAVAEALAVDRWVRAVSPEIVSVSGEPLRVRVDDHEVEAIGVLTP